MTQLRPRFRFVLSLLALLLFAPELATAQDPTPKEPGPLNSCVEESNASSSNCNCRDRHPGWILSTIIPCMREEVERAAIRYTEEFGPILEPTMYAFLTLVITIFGVRVLMAEGDPKKDAFILLVKIGAVVLFAKSLGGFIPDVFAIMDEGVDISSQVLQANASEHCQEYEDKYPGAARPWIYFDCLIGTLAGFGPQVFVGASALGLAGAALWSGQFGAIFTTGAVLAIYFVLKLVIRGIYLYLMSVMVLGFLIVISPLLIPLMWMPQTQEYFDRWLGAFMAVIAMPMFVIGFLSLSYNLIDQVALDKNNESSIAYLLDKEKAKELMSGRNERNTELFVSNTVRGEGGNASLESDSRFNFNYPIFSGAGDANSLINRLYTIDFRSGEAGKAGQLFFAFITLAILCYLLLAMLDQIIKMAQLMLGGAYFMDQAVSDNPFERGLNAVQGSIRSGISSGMQGATGPGGRAAGFAQGLAQGLVSLPGEIAKAFGQSFRR